VTPGLENVDQYFATAVERYRMFQRRSVGKPAPWTRDKHLRSWRFCNVFREDDKTTTWFREEVRRYLEGEAAVRATIAFRWFNRIEVGEILRDLLLGTWNTEEARERLRDVKPVTNGAYIISSPEGYSKLDGVLLRIDGAFSRSLVPPQGWESLEAAWRDLLEIDGMGPFMAYEVVSDLRHTPVLMNATDIRTWANAGPGCARGLGWVVNGDKRTFGGNDQEEMLDLMREILKLSEVRALWPADLPRWEMREVEHWACEFDKYKRAEAGCQLKRRFR